MKKEYKVEMKGGLWEVVLSSGCYSDYEESHLIFSGNSEEEVWLFLQRYTDDMGEERDYLWGVNSDTGVALALKWGAKKYLSKKYKGDLDDVNWSSEYNIANVSIKRLNVIYFK